MLRTPRFTARTAATMARGSSSRHLHASASRAFLFRSLDDVSADGKVVQTPHGESRYTQISSMSVAWLPLGYTNDSADASPSL
jgi:hypothetical protein